MKKLVMYSIGVAGIVAGGLAIVPNIAQAQTAGSLARGNGNGGGYQQMLQTKVTLFGMTEAQLTEQLQTKTMLQIAEEKGISEDQFHETMEASARTRWADKGLSQTEIDSRLERMEERQTGDHESNSVSRGGMGQGHFNQ